MSVVWKYELALHDEQKIAMPEGADLLHVAEQHGNLALWARVIPSGQRTVNRVVLIRGTGHPIWTQPYVGTFVTAGGDLVWHVFDGGEEPTRWAAPKRCWSSQRGCHKVAAEIPAKWASATPPQGKLVGVVDEYGTVWDGEPGASNRVGDLVVRDDEETSWLYLETR